MEEFDEQKYKQEHDWDNHYDKYMKNIEMHANGDYKSYFDVYNEDTNEYINLIDEDFINFKDQRNKNSIPNIELNNGGTSALYILGDKQINNASKVIDNANSKILYLSEEDNIAVQDIILHIRQKKAEQNQQKNEEGLQPIINNGPDGKIKSEAIDVSITTPKPKTLEQVQAEATIKKLYWSWDPRLYRLDTFLMKTEGDTTNGLRIPFATSTVASAFSELNFTVEKAFAKGLIEAGKKLPNHLNEYLKEAESANPTKESTDNNANNSNASQALLSMSETEKIIVNDTTQFENNANNFGVQSIVNPYSLTKLIGGLDTIDKTGAENYMYDIRDKRRFYGLSVNDDILAVSNPTVTQLIKWSNSDKWGRTPYSYQDFVFCKHFGLIKNNRLITLRRYTVPTYDNLQFESMYGEIEDKTNHKINQEDSENTSNKIFSPHATVVTYYGGDTGNSLANLMNFTTGIKWKDVESAIHQVDGDEGSDPQALIDKLADNKEHMFGNADAGGIIDKALSGMSTVATKTMSYGKFALALNDNVGMEEDLQNAMFSAANDPYSGIFKNRVQGPLNAIKSVKQREQGIEFSQNLSIKCSYVAKSIGGINPKAALLDVLGNCMEMVSPTAVFWGGGFRFMVHPHAYPYHDGGWRDNFMKKIYDGKFLGNDGAIATALSGIKKLGQNADGSGDFSWDNLTSNLGGIVQDGMAMLGSAIQGISNMFGGVDFLNSAADKINGIATSGDSDQDAAERKKLANNRLTQLFGNLQTMWHNKVLIASQLPNIKTTGTLLIGEPVGEWHLTIGNPLNPQMVIGNLICEKMNVTWDEELGPDDFPIGFTVEYILQHGMQRDKDAIQSMLNRGMGKYYCLPDWMHCSSDMVTYVDAYTKNAGTGDIGNITPYKNYNWMSERMLEGGIPIHGYQTAQIQGGTAPTNRGNANTQLITKFNPINSNATRTVGEIQTSMFTNSNYAIIKSLAATRKLMS